MLTVKSREEYFFATTGVFISAFIIYGILGTFMQEELFNNNNFLQLLLFGSIGGYGFSSILSGIILFARYIVKKSTLFKTVCGILFPITFAVVVYVGIFGFLPYGIYNVVILLKDKMKQKENEEK